MKNKIGLAVVVLVSAVLVQACRPMGLPGGDVPAPQKEMLRNQLIERREAIRKWAHVFPDGVASETDPANCDLNADVGCGNGDTSSWNGYGCLAATLAQDSATENARCRDIKNSQGSSGQWWRGPHKVDHPTSRDDFSRDMSLGVISYLLAKKDRSAAERWIDYMKSIGAGTALKLKLCSNASDSRCTPVGSLYGIWFLAWDAMGYNLKQIAEDPNTDSVDPLKLMYEWELTSLLTLEHEVNNNIAIANATPDLSFQLHLTVVSLWLRQAAGRNNEKVQAAADAAYAGFPGNPFYEYVSKGTTEHGINRVLNDGLCPVEAPSVTYGKRDLNYEWIWQRNDDRFTGPNKSIPQGHDCIFMINLLLSGLK